MRSLEKVIHNKFIVLKGVDRTYSKREIVIQDFSGKPIYTIDNVKIDNVVKLMKMFTPLIYHLISTLKQEQENEDKHLKINL